ncbi:GLPGLI family protein [Elizabethkingia anophelis]|nr:GLPGLI family protein [Elizabethkingia anophelis]MBE9394643.1 GLPGLI family protein [Elizabethkingia anophelis]MBE9407064.1 GLPGLI family protein [Elizabethkingia anophelis]
MKYILLILSFCVSVMQGQVHKFIYQYKYKSDSLSSHYDEAKMILEVLPNTVKFYDNEYISMDSINMKGGQMEGYTGAPMLERKRNTFYNISRVQLDFNSFSLTSTDKMDWKLTKETKMKDGYQLQKATTKFGGRNWVAWFCKEVNIDEGPYKFRGLPGLIFEVEDTGHNFIFNLVKSTNEKAAYNTTNFFETAYGKKSMPITLEKYQEKLLEIYNDPLQWARENFVEGKSKSAVMGIRITKKEQFKELSLKMQEKIRKEYNPIELDKAVKYN